MKLTAEREEGQRAKSDMEASSRPTDRTPGPTRTTTATTATTKTRIKGAQTIGEIDGGGTKG